MLSALLPPPLAQQQQPFFVYGRGLCNDNDIFFLQELGFYFNNCPEVPKGTFPMVISIFENEEKFVREVQSSLSTDVLQDVTIGEHRYDPDFTVRKRFAPFSVVARISRHTIPWMDKMDPLVCHPVTAELRKAIFQTIVVRQDAEWGHSFYYHHLLHQYIVGVMDRLMVMYRFVTNNKTPFVVRPTEETDDMRYVSDQDKIAYLGRLQTGHGVPHEVPVESNGASAIAGPGETYHNHSIQEMQSYLSNMEFEPASVRHAHAVVFAYCMQKWCEVAIHSHYFDPVFYKKIRPDEEPFFILNYVCEIVMRIESIMLWVLHQTTETAVERVAMNAVAPEDGPPIQTVSTVVKGQTVELRQDTATITDLRALLHKAGFPM